MVAYKLIQLLIAYKLIHSFNVVKCLVMSVSRQQNIHQDPGVPSHLWIPAGSSVQAQPLSNLPALGRRQSL